MMGGLFKPITVTREGVQFNSPELRAEVNKKKLSPSMIDSWLQGPADWAMSSFVEPKVQLEESIHLVRGSWFHRVMEMFFKLTPEQRSDKEFALTVLKRIMNKVTKEEFPEMITPTKENLVWLQQLVHNYIFEMPDHDWQHEKVAKVFAMGQQKDGLELFVQGQVGNCTRKVLGFVDKIIETDEGLEVQDWKSGQMYPYDPNLPISDDNSFGYWRQQILYALVMKEMGMNATSACLIFPKSKSTTWVDLNNEEAIQRAIADAEQVDRELNEAIENDYFFPFKEHKYNGWATYLAGIGHARKPNVQEDLLMQMLDMQV